MKSNYLIKLNDKIIGITNFENADPPMGVVSGKLVFKNIISGYDFIREHFHDCIIQDDPKLKMLLTENIRGLNVFNQKGTEVKGQGTNIIGSDKVGFEIIIFGIEYLLYKQEFSHHIGTYENQ